LEQNDVDRVPATSHPPVPQNIPARDAAELSQDIPSRDAAELSQDIPVRPRLFVKTFQPEMQQNCVACVESAFTVYCEANELGIAFDDVIEKGMAFWKPSTTTGQTQKPGGDEWTWAG
jgi:hypothetical protein